MPLVYRYLRPDAAAQSAAPADQLRDPAAEAAAATRAALAPTPAADFVGLLLGLINRDAEPPTHMAVVVDVPGATYRCGAARPVAGGVLRAPGFACKSASLQVCLPPATQCPQRPGAGA